MREPSPACRAFARSAWESLDGSAAALARLQFVGEGSLPSIYAVTDLASASVGAAALAVSELVATATGCAPAVTVDRRLASFWFSSSIRPIGWKAPPVWDPIAGDYTTRDGWIRLHTNAPHHRAAALNVLGCEAEKSAVAQAVARWDKTHLESAVVAAGGCAAEMRSTQEWAEHPQGRAVAAGALVQITNMDAGAARLEVSNPSRPLAGLRVLDLTRVLAGPVATRFLAGYGADVLRLDPGTWDEAAAVPEVTLGKRCAQIDLRDAQGRAAFEALLSQAHVLVHGYRSDALDRLGYGSAVRRSLAPGLVDVALCAYGWSGPWATRRGFDSLVQMSTGIADPGMRAGSGDRPIPLPVQALDHATGYLMAAAVALGVARRMTEGQGSEGRLSLARTARFLIDRDQCQPVTALAPETPGDVADAIEMTTWGEARRLRPPATIDGIPMVWTRPASALRSAEASWS